MNIDNWIVRTKKSLRIGDRVVPLRTPRRHGVLDFAPISGIVSEITANHIRLEIPGSEHPFFVYADAAFAVDTEWFEGDGDE